MTVTRRRWLTALGLLFGLPWQVHAEEVIWRAVKNPSAVRTVPHTLPTSPSKPPIASLGRPVVIASTRPSTPSTGVTPTPVGQAMAAASSSNQVTQPLTPSFGKPLPLQRDVVVRGSSPDAIAPWPPPPPPGIGVLVAEEKPKEVTPPAIIIPPLQPAGFQETGTTIPLGGMTPIPDPPVSTDAGGPPIPEPPPTDPLRETGGIAPPVPSIPPLTPHLVGQPPEVPPPPSAPFPPAPDVTPGVITDQPVAPGFFEKCKDYLTFGDRGNSSGRCAFQSDRAFQGLVSPVTMPFYFEDPRSLTEVRPIFFYQGIPKQPATFAGGDAFFFGTQLRLALTERLSVVVNELGMVSMNPNNTTPPVSKDTGFAAFRLGPKYTFLRSDSTGTVAAFGTTFEIPVGSQKVFQGTGTLSVDPYFTIGQTFGRLPNGYGSFNALANLGYSFSTDNKRSEFFYANLHFDYNIANMNFIYPLVELNWLHYTSAGTSTNLGTEGADLANLGSITRRGADFLSLAAGLRMRFTENISGGAAIEFPVSREHGLEDYRLTLDVIFRY